jgi:hypothetical protein
MALVCFAGDGINGGADCTLQSAAGDVKIAGLPVAVAPVNSPVHAHTEGPQPCGPSETLGGVTVNGRSLVAIGTPAGCTNTAHVYERSIQNAAAISSFPIALRVQIN